MKTNKPIKLKVVGTLKIEVHSFFMTNFEETYQLRKLQQVKGCAQDFNTCILILYKEFTVFVQLLKNPQKLIE